tara:strand:+ start:580 stop:1014 length:435 start_codon:yes stop_codon:yes gene_type:complete
MDKIMEAADMPRKKLQPIAEKAMEAADAPRKYTEEEAYGMLQTAMLTGQDALDSLPKEVKQMALTAAEKSLGDDPSEIGAEDAKKPVDRSETEGYTPVPGMTPYGLTDEARALITEDTLKAKEDADLERMRNMIEAEQRMRAKM